MLPLLARIHVMSNDGRNFRLWIPLFLFWLLLLPFVLFLLPILVVVATMIDLNPFDAIATLLAILASLSGTHVEVEAPNAFVFFHIF